MLCPWQPDSELSPFHLEHPFYNLLLGKVSFVLNMQQNNEFVPCIQHTVHKKFTERMFLLCFYTPHFLFLIFVPPNWWVLGRSASWTHATLPQLTKSCDYFQYLYASAGGRIWMTVCFCCLLSLLYYRCVACSFCCMSKCYSFLFFCLSSAIDSRCCPHVF